MRQELWLGLSFRIALLMLLALTPATAQDQVKSIQAEPPEEVADTIREAVSEDAYCIWIDGKEIARFWLRSNFPKGEAGAATLGVNFGAIQLSTLLGVVHLMEEWGDYKGMPVSAGVYTLRYGVEPADGNHMGVSVYRDFLLLLPAGEDTDLSAEFGVEELNRLSSGASGTPHPSVMALFPVWDEVNDPALLKNEVDQWMLTWKDGELTLGLVVQGHGEM